LLVIWATAKSKGIVGTDLLAVMGFSVITGSNARKEKRVRWLNNGGAEGSACSGSNEGDCQRELTASRSAHWKEEIPKRKRKKKERRIGGE